MIIDPDVQRIARQFGVDAGLIQAMVQAEGGRLAMIKAVQCSYPEIATIEQALTIACRSAVHALSDFVKARHAEDFSEMFGARWAPLNVANDPHNLNANWPANFLKSWGVK